LSAELLELFSAFTFLPFGPQTDEDHFRPAVLNLGAGWQPAPQPCRRAGLVAAIIGAVEEIQIEESAQAAQFHVIVLITYLIAAAGFMHIVAGSVEAFFLVLNGHLGVQPMITDFFVPVLTGNIIGGTALFALIAYAQVMKEI
jgi:formate-nitrite transporter family protein